LPEGYGAASAEDAERREGGEAKPGRRGEVISHEAVHGWPREDLGRPIKDRPMKPDFLSRPGKASDPFFVKIWLASETVEAEVSCDALGTAHKFHLTTAS